MRAEEPCIITGIVEEIIEGLDKEEAANSTVVKDAGNNDAPDVVSGNAGEVAFDGSGAGEGALADQDGAGMDMKTTSEIVKPGSVL